MTKGCLHGKTQEEKFKFFESLAQFAITDETFFEQQYNDLLPQEKKEFQDWLHTKNKVNRALLTCVDLLEKFDNKNK